MCLKEEQIFRIASQKFKITLFSLNSLLLCEEVSSHFIPFHWKKLLNLRNIFLSPMVLCEGRLHAVPTYILYVKLFFLTNFLFILVIAPPPSIQRPEILASLNRFHFICRDSFNFPNIFSTVYVMVKTYRIKYFHQRYHFVI